MALAWITENGITSETTRINAIRFAFSLEKSGWSLTRLSSDGWTAVHYWTGRVITGAY